MDGDRRITNPSNGLGNNIQKNRALNGRTSGPTRRSTKGQWTPEEDETLRRAVQRFKGKNWKKIAECFKDRTDVQCLHRWQKVLNPELVKGPWSKEEDEVIVELVKQYGPKKWSTIANHLPGRIGKQCRERWHNHLNPAINKEAWTQEEELALIRAHQIYGNKWAELTKFLPGRTDNSIKNHWNSSVKKKLDSYLKSGLLTQFQGLPQVGEQSQPIGSSSLKISGDDSCRETEIEEISECSQDSIVAGRFQNAGEMANVVLYTRGELQTTELSGSGNLPNSSPASCSEPYYPSLEDSAFSRAEISHDIDCGTKYLRQNFSNDAEVSMSGDYHFDLHDMSNISSRHLERESSGMQSYCLGASESQEVANVSLETSGGLTVSASMGNVHLGSEKSEHMLISDDECCRVLFSEAMNDECFPSRNLGGCSDSILHQSSNIQISDAGGSVPSQLPGHSSTDVMGTSCSQTFFPDPVSVDDGPLIFGGDSNNLLIAPQQEYATCSRDGFIFTNDSANSPCNDDMDMTGMQEQLDTSKDPSKLVPVNSFGSNLDTQTCPMVARPEVGNDERDAGVLCYEPPRFPGFDGPFFSCDLIQSGSEMQQEYSPLGIRQLMMPSNCLTPFRLWDSPTHDGSPDAVLKSAAKTFTGTPSIFKKRHREFLSPLSDRKKDKKLETDMTSSLTKDYSRLDIAFHGNRNITQPSEYTESQDSEKVNSNMTFSQDRNTEIVFCDSDLHENKEQEASEIEDKTKIDAGPSSQLPSGVLTEHNMNDMLLFSPKQVDFKARTPRNQHLKNFDPSPNRGVTSISPAIVSASFGSPSLSGKKLKIQSVAGTCGQHDSSSALPEMNGSTAGGNVTVETFSVFGDTPFKRSIESPSAWKSPWFINSFIAGPRVETDISIEDMYYASPGDRSYDAIGLMKQISEHTAAAYANAQVVLGNDTPKSLMKGKVNRDTQGKNNIQLGKCSTLSQNILAECRVLDFSECGTPGKKAEPGKSSTGISNFSSPSSHLLKNCR
ncbi:transcription factor MYB3R-1-like [Humulus lupulus]|uniref:transcription factor MYB3R-1-like n=1 Tax=Humulus lupulus TaxID=3486 RepID=UPI002B411A1D|nr:transcription factor MYB3R-1-like [Humulus lupulus]